MKLGLITSILDGMDFFVNGVQFTYRKHNNQVQYEVSAMSLEENRMLDEYCKKNLKQTENAPGYAEKYRISFADEAGLLEKITKDLHAAVSKDGYLILNGAEVFIRKNYGRYDVVYERKFSPGIQSFSPVEDDGEHCCQSLGTHDLVSLIKMAAC